jgi:hypothetical protein
MTSKFTPSLFFWSILFLFFLFLGYQVLHADYAFTDEAYRLWHRLDHGTVFNDFHTQGRTLGGLMVQILFEKCHSVEDIKYIRLLSLGECILLVVILFAVLKGLQRSALPALNDQLIYLTVAFVASSLTAGNWISWAVSTIIFIPAMLSLAAGYILYVRIQRSRGSSPATVFFLLLSVKPGLFGQCIFRCQEHLLTAPDALTTPGLADHRYSRRSQS